VHAGEEDNARPGWTWIELFVEESFRMTEVRDKWRKYVHGVADRRIEDGRRTEQNRARCRCVMRDAVELESMQAGVTPTCAVVLDTSMRLHG